MSYIYGYVKKTLFYSIVFFLFIPSFSFAESGFSLPKEEQPLTEWLSKMNPDVTVEQKSQNYYIDNIFSLNLSGKRTPFSLLTQGQYLGATIQKR